MDSFPLYISEIMEVILATADIIAPGRAAEMGLPVIGRRAIGLRISPDIPVCFRVIASLPAFLKPGVLVRAVGQNEVNDDFKAQLMRSGQHRPEIIKRAEHWINITVICDVIAVIFHRGFEKGRQPDGINAQGGNMVQPGCNARQVANTIIITVAEAARVDLVYYRPAPPLAIDWLVRSLAGQLFSGFFCCLGGQFHFDDLIRVCWRLTTGNVINMFHTVYNLTPYCVLASQERAARIGEADKPL